MEYLAQHIESLIFTCEQPISLKEIKIALEEIFEAKIKEEDITETLDALMENYQTDRSSFEIVKIAGGYQFLTKGAFHATIGSYLKQKIKKRLSTAALETLAIVAYKQPVTKGDIENIRGVNCDYAVQKLLEKELVDIIGRKEGPGRPLLYGVSQKFMTYFGIKDMQDLPKLKEFQNPENSIGEAAPIEEGVNSLDGISRREDDVVDIAIAVADIYDPLPPRTENSDPKGSIDNDGDGMPIADPVASNLEEGATVEAIDMPDDLEPETNPDQSESETPEVDNQEGVEFVEKTTGEFAGQTPDEILQENELPVEVENLIEPEDVTSEEEISPLEKD